MAFCGNCGAQIKDGAQFCPQCGQKTNMGQPTNLQEVQTPQQPMTQPQQQVYQQPQAYQQPQQAMPVKPNSNMVLAICTTVLCCLPLGVYAIMQATQVDSLWLAGRYNEAIAKAGEAKKYSLMGMGIGIVLQGILIIIYVIMLAFGAYNI